MKADSLNAKDLFEKNIRYVIPTFQRPYVWNKEDQWEPLWEDVQHAAERYLEAQELGHEGARAEVEAGRHFLGAIVVQQELTGSAEIETRNVIDGQQRLTTIQILIDAAQQVAEEHSWDEVAEGLNDLVLNNKRYARRDPDQLFKLWPTSMDRVAFRAAMSNSDEVAAHRDSPIVKAHEYFKFRIADWVNAHEGDEERQKRALALETALLGLLELVVIDLGTDDDSFVIFETLNARGTPLLSSDLVKNYIMQTAAHSDIDIDRFHGKYWKQFESDSWWRKEVRQGRLNRPRIDILLDYWLETRRAEEVASHNVFPTFKLEYEQGPDDLATLVTDLGTTAQRYRALDAFDPWSREGTFIYRWRTIEAGASTPLLLWLMVQADRDLGEDGLRRAMATLESFLVRRMVARATTKDYNRLFLDALAALKANDAADADAVLLEYLLNQQSESRYWPTDAQFREALIRLPLYRLLTRARLRFVLEALEDELRGPKTEEDHVIRKKLTIEHVLPQQWRDSWTHPGGEDPTQAALDRDQLLHSVGNLTLVTEALNPSLSNNPWKAKRAELSNHTVLMLNKELLDQYESHWDEDTIVERGRLLADRAVRIWARPEGLDVLQHMEESSQVLVPKGIGQTADAGQARTVDVEPARTVRQSRVWDRESFLEVLESRRNTAEAVAAARILDWCNERGLYVKWGTGSERGSFSPKLDRGGVKHSMMTVWNWAGEISIQFGSMSDPPFNDFARRREFADLLEAVPGSRGFSDDLVRKSWPTMRIGRLVEAGGVDRFLEAWDWYLDQIG